MRNVITSKIPLFVLTLLMSSYVYSASKAPNIDQYNINGTSQFHLKSSRYVLSSTQENNIQAFFLKVKKYVGQDKSKNIIIYWTTHNDKVIAERLKRELLSQHIYANNITLKRVDRRLSFYPIYVDIEQYQGSGRACRMIRMNPEPSYREQISCAVNYNSNIQLKN